MKAKRIIVLTLTFSLIFAASVYADSLWGSFEGYSIAKINVNNSEVYIGDKEVPGLVIKGTTVLPLRKVAESLHAIVKWDDTNKTANIYKPNVDLFVARSVSKQKDEYSMTSLFGKVTRNTTMKFVVFAQVDNLKTNVSGFKISIVAPNGELATDSKESTIDNSPESFWFQWPFEVNFSQKGNYLVTFSFKDENGDYSEVSEKTIVSE
jgi:hypothetical protein